LGPPTPPLPGRLVAFAAPIGSWTHFALVASQSGNYMRVFINGSLYASTIAMTPFVRGNYDLQIGGNTNFPNTNCRPKRRDDIENGWYSGPAAI
jgi:hypothetical protein